MFVSEAVCSYQLFGALVGMAERDSEHPLGVAVTKFAKSVSLEEFIVWGLRTSASKHASSRMKFEVFMG